MKYILLSSLLISKIQAENSNDECGIYYAPSSITGAGYGVFAGKDIEQYGKVGPSNNALVFHDLVNFAGDDGEKPALIHFDYFWGPETHFEQYEGDSVEVQMTGIGALANFHPYLQAVSPHQAKFHDTMFNRFEDPGAGANSYYTVDFTATRKINAGEEIFANYGENWITYRQEQGKMGAFPLIFNYNQAKSVIDVISKDLNDSKNLDLQDEAFRMIKNIVEVFDDATAMLIPESLQEFKNVMDGGLTANQLEHRSVEWLKENGQCLDNIEPRPSTLIGAGNGAFATRFIPKDGLVTAAPVLHVMDDNLFNTYDFERDPETSEKIYNEEPIGKQLGLNYCFAYKDSRLLFCPTTQIQLINHKSSRPVSPAKEEECSVTAAGEQVCGKSSFDNGPNAKIIWSNWDPNVANFLNMTLDELGNNALKRGLSFDVIATRDIQPDEEVFIDYGEEWEAAWSSHVNEFTPPNEDSFFGSYENLSAMEESEPFFRTKAELASNPYPKNIMTVCLYHEIDEYTYYPEEGLDEPLSDYPEEIVIDHYSIPGHHFIINEYDELSEPWWPCKVYRRHRSGNNEFTYTVRLFPRPIHDKPEWAVNNTPRFLRYLHSSSIRYMHKLWSSDMHLPNAFRHPIGIPDEIFPDQWKEEGVEAEQ